MACFWILWCVNCFSDPLAGGNIDLLYWKKCIAWMLLHKVLNITFLSSRTCVYLLLDFLLYALQKTVIHEFVSLNWSDSIFSLLTFYLNFLILIAALINWLLIRLGRSHELFVVTTIPHRRLLLFLIIIKHTGVDSSLFQGIYLITLLFD